MFKSGKAHISVNNIKDHRKVYDDTINDFHFLPICVFLSRSRENHAKKFYYRH